MLDIGYCSQEGHCIYASTIGCMERFGPDAMETKQYNHIIIPETFQGSRVDFVLASEREWSDTLSAEALDCEDCSCEDWRMLKEYLSNSGSHGLSSS